MRAGPDLSGGDDLCEGVVEDGLVCDQIQEVDTMHVERQDVLTALQGVIITPHLRREHYHQLWDHYYLSYRKEA